MASYSARVVRNASSSSVISGKVPITRSIWWRRCPIVLLEHIGNPERLDHLQFRKVLLPQAPDVFKKLGIARAYGIRDEEYLRLKVLTCMLPEI